jgi:hypothetical protein
MSSAVAPSIGQDPSGNFVHPKTNAAGELIVAGSVGGSAGTVKITDGTTTATITDVAGKKSLDVNVTDITLMHQNDSVSIGDGTNKMSVNADGTANIVDAQAVALLNSLTSSATPNSGGTQGAVSVGITATEAKVSTSTLTNRKSLTAFNNSAQTIYWGYNSSVTTSTGTPIFASQMVGWNVGASTHIFLIAASGTNDVRVTENA